ncbi:GNAT family N-acetyltransferase [Cytobacillus gottheilii]|uniref:GNAT family N-acetyltransferase n=1 Tax=Cytobacillus gottheilii TaxID=859144 RepID=A0ABX8FGB1_9BACI|nr:GNAT family N-acetyltransferase [Cytobacillus gottheilii]QVY63053.1 GNAT family N-acetyltransferase [Cytobacillus gottheilii]
MSIDKIVRLAELTAENWYECCSLQITENQEKFIENNAISILQSKFEPSLRPFVIYYGDQVAGFLMYNTEPEELDGYWIYRIMIDHRFQGKGIGKDASSIMISKMSNLPNAKKLVVGYHPENLGAHGLYESLGFIDYGDRFGKEMAVVKTINQ